MYPEGVHYMENLNLGIRKERSPEKIQVIDYAARHLCEDLNKMRPFTLDKFHFPVHYEVA